MEDLSFLAEQFGPVLKWEREMFPDNLFLGQGSCPLSLEGSHIPSGNARMMSSC